MTTAADRINQQLTDEARAGLRTRIDLDAFLALSSEARAIRWRQWDTAAKQDAIVQQLGRLGLDWTQAIVEAWIAKYDTKYAASPIALAVEAALERLATEHADHARTARRAGEKQDATFFQRAANAYVKALTAYRAGVRPQQTERGYLLPSSRPGQPSHLLHKDGDWVCTCESGAHIHWASALVIGIEVAMDDQARFDDPSDDREPTIATFRRRLEDTAQILDTMRAAQQPGRRLASARRPLLEAA